MRTRSKIFIKEKLQIELAVAVSEVWRLGGERERERRGMAKEGEVVCVTGGSGCIGSWLVRELLHRGYNVHATVQDLSYKSKCDARSIFHHFIIIIIIFPNILSVVLCCRGWEWNEASRRRCRRRRRRRRSWNSSPSLPDWSPRLPVHSPRC